MDEHWGHHATWNKPSDKHSVWFHLYKVPIGVKVIETERKMVVIGVRGGKTEVV